MYEPARRIANSAPTCRRWQRQSGGASEDGAARRVSRRLRAATLSASWAAALVRITRCCSFRPAPHDHAAAALRCAKMCNCDPHELISIGERVGAKRRTNLSGALDRSSDDREINVVRANFSAFYSLACTPVPLQPVQCYALLAAAVFVCVSQIQSSSVRPCDTQTQQLTEHSISRPL